MQAGEVVEAMREAMAGTTIPMDTAGLANKIVVYATCRFVVIMSGPLTAEHIVNYICRTVKINPDQKVAWAAELPVTALVDGKLVGQSYPVRSYEKKIIVGPYRWVVTDWPDRVHWFNPLLHIYVTERGVYRGWKHPLPWFMLDPNKPGDYAEIPIVVRVTGGRIVDSLREPFLFPCEPPAAEDGGPPPGGSCVLCMRAYELLAPYYTHVYSFGEPPALLCGGCWPVYRALASALPTLRRHATGSTFVGAPAERVGNAAVAIVSGKRWLIWCCGQLQAGLDAGPFDRSLKVAALAFDEPAAADELLFVSGDTEQ